MQAFQRRIHGPIKGAVLVTGTQVAKTDSAANIIGQRIDEDPVPVMYIGPTRHFVEKKWEPRFMSMVDSAPQLSQKVDRATQSKTQKRINGVDVSFVWAGSVASIAGQPAGLVIVDERDLMGVAVEGETGGDVVELANARHETYVDGKTIVFSTPTTGTVEVEVNPDTGLEHWKVPEDRDPAHPAVSSPTWQLWQQGTRHEWMLPCPDCRQYFAPRLRHLQWPEDAKPSQLNSDNVKLICPHCGVEIDETHKTWMNERGEDVSPGQRIVDGVKVGEGVVSDWYTLWVSGLCSPWRSWVVSARRYVRAARQGSSEKLQAVINTAFGELWSVSGEAPPWEDVAALRLAYPAGGKIVPEGVHEIYLTVDVQQGELFYVIRGWSRNRMESWLLEHGTVPGATNEQDVWDALATFKDRRFGVPDEEADGERGMRITRCMIDQKFRSQYVFRFCREHKNWAFPIAGRLPRDNTPEAQTPLKTSSIEVDAHGKALRGGEAGLLRWTVNTDLFKRWVHDRVEKGPDKSGWHLPEDATDDYCKQIVAEARVVKPSGTVMWLTTSRANHYLDCEMMQVACAYSRRLQHYRRPKTPPKPAVATPTAAPAPPAPKPKRTRPRRPPRNWTTQW